MLSARLLETGRRIRDFDALMMPIVNSAEHAMFHEQFPTFGRDIPALPR